jgi:hypothetical protein
VHWENKLFHNLPPCCSKIQYCSLTPPVWVHAKIFINMKLKQVTWTLGFVSEAISSIAAHIIKTIEIIIIITIIIIISKCTYLSCQHNDGIMYWGWTLVQNLVENTESSTKNSRHITCPFRTWVPHSSWTLH